MSDHWPADFMPGDKPTTQEHVVAASLEASIVQWWQTPPRLDFAAYAVTAALAEAGYEVVNRADLAAVVKVQPDMFTREAEEREMAARRRLIAIVDAASEVDR